MNDHDSILCHMKTPAIFDEVTSDSSSIRHDDSFTENGMSDFRILAHAHARHQHRS